MTDELPAGMKWVSDTTSVSLRGTDNYININEYFYDNIQFVNSSSKLVINGLKVPPVGYLTIKATAEFSNMSVGGQFENNAVISYVEEL